MIEGINLNSAGYQPNFETKANPQKAQASAAKIDPFDKQNLNQTPQKSAQSDEDARIAQAYMNKTTYEIFAAENINFDRSEEGWITKTIEKIDAMLAQKYAPGQMHEMIMRDELDTKEKVVDFTLDSYSWWLKSNSIDGKPTIWGKLLGLGTKEEEEELRAFKDSLPEDAAMGDVGAALLQRTDISIEEFKKLYAEDIEKTTKAHKEAVAKINQEMREYNENLAKQNREKKFKPIQATSKSKTYVDKDIRREFFDNFLKAEREKGTDITEILNQLAKLGKFDIKA
ncbi:cell surface protein [uncultured Campylobacter sp.]|uniref:cell surface protein n=1 Tax=uncultured Campylobacter sp. TaxID=218934 RepID=UPI0028E8A64A|nr:cell surface protein [uncultured Campylobacter sp.]